MDAKSKRSDKKSKKDPFTFISELKEELKKVSWTTKAELASATKSVLIATFCFGIGIYVVDLFIKNALDLIKRVSFFLFG